MSQHSDLSEGRNFLADNLSDHNFLSAASYHELISRTQFLPFFPDVQQQQLLYPQIYHNHQSRPYAQVSGSSESVHFPFSDLQEITLNNGQMLADTTFGLQLPLMRASSPPSLVSEKQPLPPNFSPINIEATSTPERVSVIKNVGRATGLATMIYRDTALPIKMEPASPSSEETVEDEEFIENELTGSMHSAERQLSPTPCTSKGKSDRRTAHNLIEKRYRRNINDGIIELKNLLVGEDAKLSKCHILRKAIQHIVNLRAQNSRLREENMALRKSFSSEGILYPQVSSMDVVTHETSDVAQAADKVARSQKLAIRKKNSSVSNGVVDRHRIGLCIVMLCILIFNPFHVVLRVMTSEFVTERLAYGGRTLKSVTPVASDTWEFCVFDLFCVSLSSVLNTIMFAVFLVQLLVGDEPISDAKSQAMATFARYKAQAQLEAAIGNHADAMHYYSECLRVLGRPLAQTRRDRYVSFCWQVIRHLLNLLWIGRWLPKLGRGAAAVEYYRQIAQVYYEQHKLYTTGAALDSGSLFPATLCLCAINFAEVARSDMPTEVLAEMYISLALYIQRNLGQRWKYTARYCIFRCRFLWKCRSSNVVTLPVNIAWILQPTGHAFVCNIEQRVALACCQTFTEEHSPKSPLLDVFMRFKHGILEKLAHALLFSGDISYTEFMDKLSILRSTGDPSSIWWGELMCCAVDWHLDKMSSAKQRYATIKNIPDVLRDNPLAVAVGHAFWSRKACLVKRYRVGVLQRIWLHCMKASQALKELTIDTLSTADRLEQMTIALAHDWVLWSILESMEALLVWNELGGGQVCYRTPYMLIPCYQDNLARLRRYVNRLPGVRAKLLIYETGLRLLTVVNPGQTKQFVDRCLAISNVRKRPSSKSTQHVSVGEIDRGKSDLLKHLYNLQFAGGTVKQGHFEGS